MLSVVVAIGIFLFLLLYFAFSIDEQHILFKLLLIGFVVSCLPLLAKANIDQGCDLFVNKTISFVNESQTPSGNTITEVDYEYIEYCYDDTNATTATTHLKVTYAIVWLYWIYFFIYTVYWLYEKYLMRRVQP